MKERMIKKIESLVRDRDIVLAKYLEALEEYDPLEGSMEAVERAGILHDLDKHVTNLELEVKRMEAIEILEKETVNA